jgi:hypothetical protein
MAEDYFANYELVQKLGNLPKVSQERIEVHFPMAKIDVLDVIGSDAYEEIFAGTEGYDDSDKAKLEQAESYLTLKYLLPAINIESTGSGATKATGFGDSRKENLSEFDLDRIIQRYDDNAMKILKTYARSVDEDEDEAEDLVRVQGISMVCISDEDESSSEDDL